MRKKHYFQNYWEDDKGEITGYICTLPAVLFLIIAFIAIVQVGMIKEKLEYTVYTTARAAVVCEDLHTAKKKAAEAAKLDLQYAPAAYDADTLRVKLEVLEPSNSNVNRRNGGRSRSQGPAAKWKKGNYLKCTVSVYVKTMTPFVSGRKESSIVMMIERPAENGLGDLLG